MKNNFSKSLFSVFLFCKVFTFLCNFCNLCLNPKPTKGYTGIELSVTFVTEGPLNQA